MAIPPTVSCVKEAIASVVVPAHNEERLLPALLDALTEGEPGLLEIVVVPNGCTDATAAVARRYPVAVIETEIPSKRDALRLGASRTTTLPRVYIDGDVVISGRDVAMLVETMLARGALAAAPGRKLVLDRSSTAVRWYYAIWARLPGIRTGLFGRGVIAVSAAGVRRLEALAPVMADDLVASNSFTPRERTIVEEAVSHILAPRTVDDLLRRRVRAVTGVAEIETIRARGGSDRGRRPAISCGLSLAPRGGFRSSRCSSS